MIFHGVVRISVLSGMRYALKTNNNIAYICHYHVVFCPK